ncbi:endonuclease domain-containing protein [Microvirga sp. 2TAF3]|uniref:endonuclease domain-containing protein n=1 Tax=Microvirga sp. 2TAF3 TaxID=3233014 RepID=UPI003F986637
MPRSRKPGTLRSRSLRKQMTEAEKRLWWHLERVPVEKGHFRRLAAIGPYVVDFVCHSAGLVIEVDGFQHGFEEGLRADAARTAWLSSQGYQVLRFWNDEVMSQIDVVLDTIHAALYTASSNGAGAVTPTPSPSPQGGGE